MKPLTSKELPLFTNMARKAIRGHCYGSLAGVTIQMSGHFTLKARDSATGARRGTLTTLHGTIETPAFMPVGTQGTVKAMTPAQIDEVGSQIILGNTYHLHLRPGSELVRDMGGLHRFMGWDKPILTDSGGFQVFSLAKLRQVSDDGIAFQSHLTGEDVFLGPREAMQIQRNLGSDIAMVLDECPPYPCERDACRQAVQRSIRWARECLAVSEESGFIDSGHHLFGIVQGSNFEDLRQECAEALREMPFPGYAVGGVSVGEPEPEMLFQVGATTKHLPQEKPRYAMGLGTPPQMLKMIALGVDMFDCVMPTRMARHGGAFTPWGPVNIRNERFRRDARPLIEDYGSYTCRHFSRAYLRHLVTAGEFLAATLLSMHNVYFFLDLMRQAREHVEAGDYATWHQGWIERYELGVEEKNL